MMNQIEIVSVAILSLAGLEAAYVVVIHLDLDIGAVAQDMFPVAENVTSREIGILVHDGGVRCGERCNFDAFTGLAVIQIALNGQRVAARYIPIGAEAALCSSLIVKLVAVGVELRAGVRAFGVHAVTE